MSQAIRQPAALPGLGQVVGRASPRLLLLLVGGDKSTQQKDIAKAIELAKNFQE